jgi:hypothetical protein
VDVNLSADSDESESDTNGEDATTTDNRLEKFLAQFDEQVAAEVSTISQKYEQEILRQQRKGLNPLTKKLIEKARQEQSKAIEKKKQELEELKLREVDKIKAGIE